jgi:hypothetical protein
MVAVALAISLLAILLIIPGCAAAVWNWSLVGSRCFWHWAAKPG